MIPTNTVINYCSYFPYKLYFFLCKWRLWTCNLGRVLPTGLISSDNNVMDHNFHSFTLTPSEVCPIHALYIWIPFPAILIYQTTMTNITNKCNNTIQDHSPWPTSSTENPMVKELQEKNAELEHCLQKYKCMLYIVVWALLTLYCSKTEDYTDYYQTPYSPERRGRESQAGVHPLQRNGDG